MFKHLSQLARFIDQATNAPFEVWLLNDHLAQGRSGVYILERNTGNPFFWKWLKPHHIERIYALLNSDAFGRDKLKTLTEITLPHPEHCTQVAARVAADHREAMDANNTLDIAYRSAVALLVNVGQNSAFTAQIKPQNIAETFQAARAESNLWQTAELLKAVQDNPRLRSGLNADEVVEIYKSIWISDKNSYKLLEARQIQDYTRRDPALHEKLAAAVAKSCEYTLAKKSIRATQDLLELVADDPVLQACLPAVLADAYQSGDWAARGRIVDITADTPFLRSGLKEAITRAYTDAIHKAAAQESDHIIRDTLKIPELKDDMPPLFATAFRDAITEKNAEMLCLVIKHAEDYPETYELLNGEDMKNACFLALDARFAHSMIKSLAEHSDFYPALKDGLSQGMAHIYETTMCGARTQLAELVVHLVSGDRALLQYIPLAVAAVYHAARNQILAPDTSKFFDTSFKEMQKNAEAAPESDFASEWAFYERMNPATALEAFRKTRTDNFCDYVLAKVGEHISQAPTLGSCLFPSFGTRH